MEVPANATNEPDESLVRDLYLFFELVRKRCPADWVPDQNSEISPGPEPWANRF